MIEQPAAEVCMESVVMELFSKESNFAIVRTPGRKFPGVVIQGDSLASMCCSAQAVVDALIELDRDGALGESEALDEAQRLLGALQGRLSLYEECLKKHGIELPYFRRPTP